MWTEKYKTSGHRYCSEYAIIQHIFIGDISPLKSTPESSKKHSQFNNTTNHQINKHKQNEEKNIHINTQKRRRKNYQLKKEGLAITREICIPHYMENKFAQISTRRPTDMLSQEIYNSVLNNRECVHILGLRKEKI